MPIAAAISGAAGILGSAINGGMSKRAAKQYNKGQMQIAQMNNQWNAEQAAINRQWEENQVAKQNQWNLEQWHRENEYNSPVAQAERLKAAGINPAFMSADGGSAGSVTSASPGSVASPTASTPNTMPAQFSIDLSSVSQAINSYYANKESTSRRIGNEINNGLNSMYGKDLMLADIASRVNGKFEFLSPDYKKSRMDYASSLAAMSIDKDKVELQQMKDANMLTKVQTAAATLSAKAQSVLNKYLDANQQADLMIKVATLKDVYKSTDLKDAQIKKEIASTIKTYAETKGVQINNHIAMQTAASLIAATNAANDYQVETFNESMRNFIPQFEAQNKRLRYVLDNTKNLFELDQYGHDGFGRNKGNFATKFNQFLNMYGRELIGGFMNRLLK